MSSSSSVDEVKGRDLDINSSYTPWQLSCVVLKEVSLVHILVSSAQASFKKVNIYMYIYHIMVSVRILRKGDKRRFVEV